MSELTHTVEALLFVASEPLSLRELCELTEADHHALRARLHLVADQRAGQA